MTEEFSSKEGLDTRKIAGVGEESLAETTKRSPQIELSAKESKPDAASAPHTQNVKKDPAEKKPETPDAQQPSANLAEDALDDLDDLEFMLEEIESQIAPLAL